MPDFMRIKSRRRIFRSLVVVFDKPATDRRTRTSVVIIQQGPRAVRSCTDICRSAIIDQGQSPFLIDTASKTHGSPNGGGRSMSSRCRNIQGVNKPKSQAQAHPQSPAGNHVFSIEFTSRPLPRTIAKRIGSPTRAERASKARLQLKNQHHVPWPFCRTARKRRPTTPSGVSNHFSAPNFMRINPQKPDQTANQNS